MGDAYEYASVRIHNPRGEYVPDVCNQHHGGYDKYGYNLPDGWYKRLFHVVFIREHDTR